jgi:hypothetical protein
LQLTDGDVTPQVEGENPAVAPGFVFSTRLGATRSGVRFMPQQNRTFPDKKRLGRKLARFESGVCEERGEWVVRFSTQNPDSANYEIGSPLSLLPPCKNPNSELAAEGHSGKPLEGYGSLWLLNLPLFHCSDVKSVIREGGVKPSRSVMGQKTEF